MDYTIVEMPARAIAGQRIRTANDSPSCTADIGGLWQLSLIHISEPTRPY